MEHSGGEFHERIAPLTPRSWCALGVACRLGRGVRGGDWSEKDHQKQALVLAGVRTVYGRPFAEVPKDVVAYKMGRHSEYAFQMLRTLERGGCRADVLDESLVALPNVVLHAWRAFPKVRELVISLMISAADLGRGDVMRLLLRLYEQEPGEDLLERAQRTELGIPEVVDPNFPLPQQNPPKVYFKEALWTCLTRAIMGGHLEVVQAIIRSGEIDVNWMGPADPGTHMEQKQSALMIAAWYGRRDVMTFLLDAHADLQAQTSFGRSALTCAVRGLQFDVVRDLVRRGIRVHNAAAAELAPLYAGFWTDGRVELLDMVLECLLHPGVVGRPAREAEVNKLHAELVAYMRENPGA